MTYIRERKLLAIIENNHIEAFEEYLNGFDQSNNLVLKNILNSHDHTRIAIDLTLPQLINKYSERYIQSIGNIEVKDEHTVKYDYCIIWARDVSHIFENHVEIEIYVMISSLLDNEMDFHDFSVALGRASKARLIYELRDYVHYELHWYKEKEKRVRISNIESLENEMQLIEAITVMKDSLTAR